MRAAHVPTVLRRAVIPLVIPLVVALLLAALVPIGPRVARAAGHDPASDLQLIERLLYATTLHDFVVIVAAGDPWLDTSTDWCSAPLVASSGRSFDFHDPCRRHDFGYRNLKLLDDRYGRPGTYWNAASRKRVDRQFLTDMKAHCRARRWYDEPPCMAWAATYYSAVRVAGGP